MLALSRGGSSHHPSPMGRLESRLPGMPRQVRRSNTVQASFRLLTVHFPFARIHSWHLVSDSNGITNRKETEMTARDNDIHNPANTLVGFADTPARTPYGTN